jgi:hypothetical protein
MDSRIGKRVIGPAVLASFVVISAALIATYPINQARAYPVGNATGEYKFGTISSIQNDENGIPAWVIFGHWKGNLAYNQSLIQGQGNDILGGESFNAQFEMIMLNGSAGHTHTITNFVASNASQIDNSTMIFNGTATASMREGPVTDVPSSISITGDKVIAILLDPSTVGNHYGNTPIYGLVMDDSEDRRPIRILNNTQMGR